MLSCNYAGCSLGIGDWRILQLMCDIHNVGLQLSPAILEFLMMACIS